MARVRAGGLAKRNGGAPSFTPLRPTQPLEPGIDVSKLKPSADFGENRSITFCDFIDVRFFHVRLIEWPRSIEQSCLSSSRGADNSDSAPL